MKHESVWLPQGTGQIKIGRKFSGVRKMLSHPGITMGSGNFLLYVDGNDFIFLAWSSYKGVLAVCLLPLIPDQSILLPQVILQVCVFCDFCSRLFHLRVLTFQTACKAEATQQHVDSYVSRPLHAS